MPSGIRTARLPRTSRAWWTVGVCVAVLVSGCSTTISGRAVGTASVPTTSTKSSSGTPTTTADIGPIPAGLTKFYTQQLKWGDCVQYAESDLDKQVYGMGDLECTRMAVPVDYADPSGQQAQIGLLRAKATNTDQRIGSVVFNPGGPGGSGMSLVSQLAVGGVAATLQERFDLVGFDPRGTGASLPRVQCNTDAERDAARAANLRTTTEAGIAAINQQAKDQADRCFERTGKEQGISGKSFLANIGTRDVAKDMDVLRAVLGDRKLTYVGYSYGTRLGTEYAEKFPQNVRALILDGAVDPSQDSATSVLDQAKSFQKTFNAYSAACARQSGCPLTGDATKAFQQLTRPLLEKPLKLSDGRVLTYGDAVTGTIQAMYSETLWPRLTTALTGLRSGNGLPLMKLADSYEDRDDSGKYSTLQDAFTAINCVDRTRDTGKDLDAEVEKEYANAAPFADSGDPPARTASICDYWQVPVTSKPHTPKASGLPKVLVISTTGDPATPYQAGVTLAKALRASLLTVKGDRHTAYLGAQISCVDELGTQYLVDPDDPPADTTCG